MATPDIPLPASAPPPGAVAFEQLRRTALSLPGPDTEPLDERIGGPTTSVLPEEDEASLRALEDLLAGERALPRWIGWRLRLLVAAVLTSCLAVFGVAHWLAAQPALHATWKATADGRIRLSATDHPSLRHAVGSDLILIAGPRGETIEADPVVLLGSLRWISDDPMRARYADLRHRLTHALLPSATHPDQAEDATPALPGSTGRTITLSFSDGTVVTLSAEPRGLAGLPPVFWLLAALAVVVAVASVIVVLAGPEGRTFIYALIALAQSGNLLLIAIESTLDFATPHAFTDWDWHVRVALDLITAACFVQIASMTPRRLPGWGAITVVAWCATAGLLVAAWPSHGAQAWWRVQVGSGALGLLAIGLMTWSNYRHMHPFTLVLRRFALLGFGTWLLLSSAVAVSGSTPDLRQGITAVGSMIWYVFLASLLLVPYLTRSQQALREFSLLAATSTVATSLDLLFVAVFSLGQFTSVTLSLVLTLGAYLAARHWLLHHVTGSGRQTMERLFDRLYRMARELELHPQRGAALLTRLMRELFEPLEVLPLQQSTQASAVLGNGSALVVPLSKLPPSGSATHPAALLVRHAQRGQRLFSMEDARLTDRIIDQLHRAVAYAHAVERGRIEERLRIAQDLHDDIGARLLTLMYQAPSKEMGEYIRHTLQDLKTLTRGLAAQSQKLSDAAAEWKADLTQRLELAHCRLIWKLDYDVDVELGMVQWSALTRILRELISNTIAHAHATVVAVTITLQADKLQLSVADNGDGGDPRNWKHGLGLGGVRKRVKQLRGTVSWEPRQPSGIICRVVVSRLSASA